MADDDALLLLYRQLDERVERIEKALIDENGKAKPARIGLDKATVSMVLTGFIGPIVTAWIATH